MWILHLTNLQLVVKIITMILDGIFELFDKVKEVVTWKNIRPYIFLLLISVGFSFGLSVVFPFWNTFSIVSSVGLGLWYLWRYEVVQRATDIIEPYEEKLKEYDFQLTEITNINYGLEELVSEQKEVISEYETIFDAQLVELPCVCGDNIFKGLFSPSSENICSCEKCKNTYRVTIQYDTVLISEPLNNEEIFTQLKVAEETNKN